MHIKDRILVEILCICALIAFIVMGVFLLRIVKSGVVPDFLGGGRLGLCTRSILDCVDRIVLFM